MRAILLVALATASILASAMAARQADAAMVLSGRAGSVAQVQPVTNVCGCEWLRARADAARGEASKRHFRSRPDLTSSLPRPAAPPAKARLSGPPG